MLSPQSFEKMKERISKNDEKINLLQAINTNLRERQEIETNYKSLSLKLTKMQKEETERREEYDKTRKSYLNELENKGAKLYKEHAKILHQIEHIEWHLEGCSKHKPCHGQSHESICGGGSIHSKKLTTSTSCQSSAGTGTGTSTTRPSHMANLKNTSERLIKNIIDLRKRSYVLQERLEHEIKRKKDMEKKLSDLRKDISRQKKLLSMRRATPLPSLLC